MQGLYFLNIKGKEGYRKATDAFRKVLAMDPEYAPAWTAIARTYTNQVRAGLLTREQGRELAMAAIDRALDLEPNNAQVLGVAASLAGSLGRATESTELHERALALGENDLAFEWLTRAFEERDVRLSWFLTDVHLRKLQDDPRYPVFLEKIGLLAAWKAMSN